MQPKPRKFTANKTLVHHLMDEFQQWQADWDRWDRHKDNWFRAVFLTQPPDYDEFLERCETKFAVYYAELEPFNPDSEVKPDAETTNTRG